jgi:hypothetical protein
MATGKRKAIGPEFVRVTAKREEFHYDIHDVRGVGVCACAHGNSRAACGCSAGCRTEKCACMQLMGGLRAVAPPTVLAANKHEGLVVSEAPRRTPKRYPNAMSILSVARSVRRDKSREWRSRDRWEVVIQLAKSVSAVTVLATTLIRLF